MKKGQPKPPRKKHQDGEGSGLADGALTEPDRLEGQGHADDEHTGRADEGRNAAQVDSGENTCHDDFTFFQVAGKLPGAERGNPSNQSSVA